MGWGFQVGSELSDVMVIKRLLYYEISVFIRLLLNYIILLTYLSSFKYFI